MAKPAMMAMRVVAALTWCHGVSKGFARLLQSGEPKYGNGFGLLPLDGSTPPEVHFWACLVTSLLATYIEQTAFATRDYTSVALSASGGHLGDGLGEAQAHRSPPRPAWVSDALQAEVCCCSVVGHAWLRWPPACACMHAGLRARMRLGPAAGAAALLPSAAAVCAPHYSALPLRRD